MSRFAAGEGLPATHDRIDVLRIDLESITTAAGALCRNHGRATAEETIEDDVAPGRGIHDRVGD